MVTSHLVKVTLVILLQIFQCQGTRTKKQGSNTAFLPAIWIPETESKCATTKVNFNTTSFDFTWKLDGLWEFYKNVLSDDETRVFKSNQELKLESNGSEVDIVLKFQMTTKRIESVVTLIVRKNEFIKGETDFVNSLKNSEFKGDLAIQIGPVLIPIEKTGVRKLATTVEFKWEKNDMDFNSVREQVKDIKDIDINLVYKFTHFSIGPNINENVSSSCAKDAQVFPNQLGFMLEILQSKPNLKM